MGIKPKAIARIGSRSVLIPFPTKGEAPLAPPIPLAPHEPTGVTASAGIFTVEVALSWTDASNNEDGFYVYRNTSNTTTGATLIATLGAGVQTYVDNDDNSGANAPAEGTTYYYWVSSFNAGGESVKSPAASNGTGGVTTIWLVPTAPSSLSATAVSSSQINLSWTDNSNNETGFEIFRSTDGLTFSSIATVGAGVTTYNNTGLAASTQYYYKVWAYNPGETSTYSNTANATTQAAAGVPTPTFEVNFTTDPYIGTRFSRASRGTFVNSSGFIQTAELNLALYSGQLNNSYWTTGSETITVNAAVAPDGTSTAARHTELSTTSFHGMQRSSVAGVTAGSPHTFSIYVKRDPTSPSVRNVSLWLYYDLSATPNSSRNAVLFNTATGAYINQSTFNSSGVSYGSEDVGNGWFRYWVTVTAPATATGMRCGIYMFQDGTTTLLDYRAEIYAGNGSSVLYWGPQLVASASRLPYVHTAASAVGTPRITHDPVTLAPLGLLMEPAATNLMLRSEDWSTVWTLGGLTQTAAAATSPQNATNATRFVETATTGAHETYQLLWGNNACFSLFVKADQRTAASLAIYRANTDWMTATFDLANGTAGAVAVGISSGWSSTASSISAVGNGWYRCEIRGTHSSTGNLYCGISLNTTATPTRQASNGVESYTGNTANGIYVWGAQLEGVNGPATSYIATTGSTVTRNADGWNILSAEMPSIWNQSQGSLVAKGRIYTPFTNSGLVRTGVASSNANSYLTSTASIGGTRPAIRVAGVNYNSGPAGSPTSGAVVNTGYSYNQATPAFTGFVGGTAGSTLTNSLSGVTIDKLEVGTRIESNMAGAAAYGTPHSVYIIERLRYWNTALSNADMQTATT